MLSRIIFLSNNVWNVRLTENALLLFRSSMSSRGEWSLIELYHERGSCDVYIKYSNLFSCI